jgi:hypothetical protein
MRRHLIVLVAVLGCGGSGSKTGGTGGSSGSTGSGGTNTGPAPGPGPGVTGGGQIGGGKAGGDGPPVQPVGESSYWLQNTSLKVQPSTAPGTMGGTMAIEGARGATESYQIVLRGALSGVDATPTALTDGMGDTIPAGNVQLFREAFTNFAGITVMGGTVPAPAKSPTSDGMVPDALIPLHDPYTGDSLGAPFDVAAGKNQPLWVDVRIPIDQPFGTYTGAVTLSSSGASITVPVSVTVWDVTLPDMRAIPTWFKMDYNYLEKYHAGVHDCYYASCKSDSLPRQIIKRYQELMHQHRIDPKSTLVSFPNGCSTTPDFSSLDSGLAPYMDGSYWADGVPSSVLPAPFGPGDTASNPQSCGQTTYTAIAKAWATHLKDKGWFDRTYVYAEDEPSDTELPTIAQQAQWMSAGDADWKARIFDTTMANTTSAPILDPAIGIYVLCLKCYDSWYFMGGNVYGRTQWATRLQQGMKFWFYESNAQGPPYAGLPSNTLDAAEPRMMMWGSWYEGATGFLYWAVDNWDDADPWGPNIQFNKTGDGVIIYPGDHSGTNTGKGSPAGIAMAGPVPTIRLKMTRSGLQDWALFLLADRNGMRDAAKTQVATVYGQLGGCDYTGCPKPLNGTWYWKTDYTMMQAARRSIVNALLGK